MAVAPPTQCFTNADAWIECLSAGKQLAEADVARLCEKVIRRRLRGCVSGMGGFDEGGGHTSK